LFINNNIIEDINKTFVRKAHSFAHLMRAIFSSNQLVLDAEVVCRLKWLP